MLTFIDEVVAAFVAALGEGGGRLGQSAMPLLLVAATIGWYTTHGKELASGAYQLGDALASALLRIIAVGIYYWVIFNFHAMTTQALATFIQWGGASSGGTLTADMLTKPSLIVERGLAIAAPLAQSDSWMRRITLSFQLLNHPGDFVAWVAITIAFYAIAMQIGFAVIEFHLAAAVSIVLIPLGVWRGTASLCEFAIGWLTGGLIRVLVTTSLVAISLPLMERLGGASTDAFWQHHEVLLKVGGSLLFALLACYVPNRAATMAGRATLALTGSAVLSGAMTFARFSQAGGQAIRGMSQMLQRRTA